MVEKRETQMTGSGRRQACATGGISGSGGNFGNLVDKEFIGRYSGVELFLGSKVLCALF